jgi:hypothetical protein
VPLNIGENTPLTRRKSLHVFYHSRIAFFLRLVIFRVNESLDLRRRGLYREAQNKERYQHGSEEGRCDIGEKAEDQE